MSKRLIAFLVAACFIMTSPALAVKKVPKKPNQQATPAGQASGQEKPATKEKSFRKEPQSLPEREMRPVPAPERMRIKKKDRFIDEDRDGINDRLKKPPTVKKKKKANRPKKAETRRRPR
jgi:hypothetical protein